MTLTGKAAARLVCGCASVLLSYPEESFVDDLDAVRRALDRLPRRRVRARLTDTVTWLSTMSVLQAATQYVEAFDLARGVTLHLTYYRYGDTRERGMALVRLAEAYRAGGVGLRTGELPDFLPAVLELAAISPIGMELLREQRSELEMLRAELVAARSGYASVVEAIGEVLGPLSAATRATLQRLRAQGPPTERVGLERSEPSELLVQHWPGREACAPPANPLR